MSLMGAEIETIDAREPTLFGWPVRVTLTPERREVVDVTHALRWDSENITLDQSVVLDAIHSAQSRGFGLTTTEEA